MMPSAVQSAVDKNKNGYRKNELIIKLIFITELGWLSRLGHTSSKYHLNGIFLRFPH